MRALKCRSIDPRLAVEGNRDAYLNTQLRAVCARVGDMIRETNNRVFLLFMHKMHFRSASDISSLLSNALKTKFRIDTLCDFLFLA